MRRLRPLSSETSYHILYLEVHGTYEPIITVLVTLLIIPLKGLIGVIPLISRVISPVRIG